MSRFPRSRVLCLWSLSLYGVATALLGWYAVYVLASSFAKGLVWWVAPVFFSCVPAAVTVLLLARRPPRLKAPAFISGVALFIFAMLWIGVLAMVVASRRAQ